MFDAFVKETTTAPNTSVSCSLNGATVPFRTYASVYGNGASVFYYMEDSTQAEWGIGTFNTGSPHTLSRTTVLGNTAGTTARLNFAGTTRVYSQIPSSRLVYLHTSGLMVNGTLLAALSGANVTFQGRVGGANIGKGVVVVRSSAQVIPHAQNTAIAWDAFSFDDFGGTWAASPNPTQIVVPAGITRCKIEANGGFAANATGTRALFTRKNGSGGHGQPYDARPVNSGTDTTFINIKSGVLPVAGGDILEVLAYQSSGGDLNFGGLANTTWASVLFLA